MRKRKIELVVIQGGKHKPVIKESPYYQMLDKSEEVSFRLSEEDLSHTYLTDQHLPGNSKEEHLAYVVMAMNYFLNNIPDDLFIYMAEKNHSRIKVKVDLGTVDRTTSDGSWCKMRCDTHIKNIVEKLAQKLKCSKPQVIRHCLRICAYLIEESSSGTIFYLERSTRNNSKALDLGFLFNKGISSEHQLKST